MHTENFSDNRESLIREKDRISRLIKTMDKGIFNEELGGELSVVDNHPSDVAEEVAMANTAMALRGNEINILNQIDKAIDKIDNGTYGVCSSCGGEIQQERLQFIPYVEYCIDCQDNISSSYEEEIGRVKSDQGTFAPFNYGFNDNRDDPGFDGEDTYQAVEKMNYVDGVDEYYYRDDECVEAVDKISNEYYRNQLK